MKKLRLRDVKCPDQSHTVKKLWSPDGTPGCLLQLPVPPTVPHLLLPSQAALSPQSRWTGFSPDQAGVETALPCFRQSRTAWVGLVFIQQTFSALLGVCGLVLNTEDTEVTKGQVGLEMCKVESLV